jgi:hypothetical protein
VIYLSVPPVADEHRRLVVSGDVGVMLTPRVRRKIDACKAWPVWAADNGCFTAGESFDLDVYLEWLRAMKVVSGCLFATAPDVLGDASATWKRSRGVLPKLRELGYRAALVAQNGITSVDWDAIDCLFVGGDDAFKSSEIADRLCREARARGVWTHLGRVNSETRALRAKAIGYQSADGTLLRFGPDANIGRVKRWIRLFAQRELFS